MHNIQEENGNNSNNLSPVQTTASCHPSLHHPISSTTRSQAQPSLMPLQTSIPAHKIQEKRKNSCHPSAAQITTSSHPSLNYPITSTTKPQAQPSLQPQTSTPMHSIQGNIQQSVGVKETTLFKDNLPIVDRQNKQHQSVVVSQQASEKWVAGTLPDLSTNTSDRQTKPSSQQTSQENLVMEINPNVPRETRFNIQKPSLPGASTLYHQITP